MNMSKSVFNIDFVCMGGTERETVRDSEKGIERNRQKE